MLTVIFTCATSFAHYYGEKAINENGNWHFFVKTDYESAKKYLLSDSSLKDIGFNKDLSTEEQSYKIYSNKANYLRVGTIYQGDKQYIKDTVTCKYDGALPYCYFGSADCFCVNHFARAKGGENYCN